MLNLSVSADLNDCSLSSDVISILPTAVLTAMAMQLSSRAEGLGGLSMEAINRGRLGLAFSHAFGLAFPLIFCLRSDLRYPVDDFLVEKPNQFALIHEVSWQNASLFVHLSRLASA